MYRISIYIVIQIIAWQGLALGGLILAFLTTQLLRVAPVFVGAGAGVFEMAYAFGLLLIPVATWAVTPAFFIGVFSTAGRMAADGELTAIDASGLGRGRLSIGPMALAISISFFLAWLWLDVAPRSQGALRSVAVKLATKALSGQIEPGRFLSPLHGITLFADDKIQDRTFKGIFIEDARNAEHPVQFAAKSAKIETDPSRWMLTIEMRDGSAFYPAVSADDTHVAVSFENLSIEIPLAAEIEQRLDFLPSSLAVPTGRLMGPAPPGVEPCRWRYALWRRIAGPLGFLALSFLAVVLAFGISWRRRGVAVAVAAIIFMAFHLLCRFGESLMQAHILDAVSAALLPILSVALALALLRVLHLRRFRAR